MNTARTIVGLVTALLIPVPLAAQTSPYAHEAPRAIKALSTEEVRDLLDGAGMGFARAAELNGIPGPRHALDLADSLQLDESQRTGLRDVFARMQTRARALGGVIVAAERDLDSLFASGDATAPEVERRTAELGRLYGDLRATHLTAHLETARVLSAQQSARYAQLRGYVDSDREGAAGGEHGAHH